MSTKKFLDLSGLSRVWGKIGDKFALKSLYDDTTINVGRRANTTVGAKSVAEGTNTTASGSNAHAEGSYSTASGNNSHAEGNYAIASNTCSHAEGYYANASGTYSHAEGNNTFATASYSHTEGAYNVASGIASHTEGGNNSTISVKITGEADATTYTVTDTSNIRVGGYIKYSTTVSKITSFVENTSITVNATLSATALSNVTAYIIINTASGNFSHAEGNKNIASGIASHVEGQLSLASGTATHSEGIGTIAQRKSQHVQGEYNVADTSGTTTTRGKYADIVGNGTDDSNRSNAYTLDWNGNGCFTGDVYTGAADKDSANAKKLATEDYVDSLVVDGAQKTILYNGKANSTAILSGNTQELPNSIFNYDLIVVGFNCMVQNVSRSMEICDVIYPNSSLITWCDATGAGATGAHHIYNGNQSFNNVYRVMWGFTDATHIRNIVSSVVNSGNYPWVDAGICYVIGYKFSALPDGYMQEPATEGTSGQVLTTDGNGGRTWTTVQGGGSGGVGQNVAGTSYTIDSDTYTAETATEIFNDYRTRGTTTDEKYGMTLNSGNICVGEYSHCEGMGNTVLGKYAHAEGINTTSNGGYGSHAEGLQCNANAEGSHAEGENTNANGVDSHAEGFSCTANEFASHAEGESTNAYAAASHVEGKHTIASCIGQHVEGQYNIEDENDAYAHIVGNGYWDEEANEGEGEEVRSNAHTIDWSGNGWFSGDVYVGSTSGTNKDAGSKKLATEEYVDDKITYGTSDLTAGTSPLTTGTLYFVYE